MQAVSIWGELPFWPQKQHLSTVFCDGGGKQATLNSFVMVILPHIMFKLPKDLISSYYHPCLGLGFQHTNLEWRNLSNQIMGLRVCIIFIYLLPCTKIIYILSHLTYIKGFHAFRITVAYEDTCFLTAFPKVVLCDF